MLKDCKYRLPCGWCDKYDRQCLLIEHEVGKQENNSKPKECEHDWEIEYTYMSIPKDKNKEAYYVVKRVCRKCYESELRKTDLYGNHIT